MTKTIQYLIDVLRRPILLGERSNEVLAVDTVVSALVRKDDKDN